MATPMWRTQSYDVADEETTEGAFRIALPVPPAILRWRAKLSECSSSQPSLTQPVAQEAHVGWSDPKHLGNHEGRGPSAFHVVHVAA